MPEDVIRLTRLACVTTTRRDPVARPAPDLVRRAFTVDGPDRLWVADITYIATWAGFLFLAVVLDAWSRRVVGWAMAAHLHTELVLDTLHVAIGQRRPTQVIHHSDQGCQPEFNWSSQHDLCESIVEPHRVPRPVFASRESFAAWC